MALRGPFFIVAVATAAVFYGADSPWFDINGFVFDGQDPAIRVGVDIDPVWVYAGGGVAAFGLLVYLLLRIRFAFLLPLLAGAGIGWVLISAYSDLRDFSDLGSIGWGAWMTLGGAVVLVFSSLLALQSGARR